MISTLNLVLAIIASLVSLPFTLNSLLDSPENIVETLPNINDLDGALGYNDSAALNGMVNSFLK